ncbi:MAG TPA: methylated-DNA--[protein]-cysteine S-methyltransferase [Myxococcota bacterium]|nr:methylated-DNA--[protein]-cysteine S-methyltransferase [Myxococcota bacterium]
MSALGLAYFDTPLGCCGLAWSERGVVGVQLPEGGLAATRARLRRRFPGASEAAPPAAVQRAIDGLVALLRGEASALHEIELDFAALPTFQRRVYESARAIPPGETRSYGELAAQLGDARLARAVGQALGKNPLALLVPCHRVLAADGRLGGFSANGGAATKRRILALEGAAAAAQRGLFAGEPGPTWDAAAALAHLREVEPTLARVANGADPPRPDLRHAASVFGMLAEAIVYQQLTAKAAATIHARVCALFPHSADGFTPRQILRSSEAKLRGAGLSRAKAAALRDLAKRTAAGELPSLTEVRALDDEEIVERLTTVRGIGRWTVEMLLIFRLGRPDVLPAGDYGVRKGFAAAFRKRTLPTPKQLLARGERWAPYRTAASLLLWRAASV